MTGGKQIRVLHLIGVMNCGGAENMLMNIFRQIDRQRICFDFLVHVREPATGYFDAEILALGGTIHYIPSQGSIGLWNYIRQLKRFLIDHGPYDVVHCHMDWQGGFAALAARQVGVKTIIVHAHTAALMNRSLPVRLLLPVAKWLARTCGTAHWGCSTAACRFLFGNLPGQRVIPNAIALNRYLNIDLAIRQQWRQNWGCNDNCLVLGHAGSFSPLKNQHFLIEIADLLHRRGINVRLIFAGNHDNDYGQAAKSKAEKLGLANQVIFLGVRSDLPEILSAIDLFLFPSEFEGLGIVAVEAQSAGRFCLFSPGIPPEVDMGLNLIRRMDNMDPQAWAEAILATDPANPPAKEFIARQIQDRGFDIVQNAKKIERFYLGEPAW